MHPTIENHTPFVFEALHLLDEQCRPLLVALVKATFRIRRSGCEIAEEQLPFEPAGICFGDDPATSSYRYEPEVAFYKPATDVVVNGHAHAPAPGTRVMRVEVRVGSLRRELHVFGDRVWFNSAGLPAISTPLAFERMPLIYERAFGGWDRSDPDPERHTPELRNPVGKGFRRQGFGEEYALPNIEDPAARITAPRDTPAPAGLGFVSPHWHPRARLAGTYDAEWQRERSPLLPSDFDRRHFNAASPGLVAPGYLEGGEPVRLEGLAPDGGLQFALPQVSAPLVSVRLHQGQPANVQLHLDTVIIEPDELRVIQLWRGHLSLPQGPHDVAEVSARLAA